MNWKKVPKPSKFVDLSNEGAEPTNYTLVSAELYPAHQSRSDLFVIASSTQLCILQPISQQI